MNELPRPASNAERLDRAVEEVVAEITDRLQAGQAVDVEAYCARCPEAADRIRGLVRTVQVMEALKPTPADGDGQEEGLTGTLGDYRILREVGRGGMGVVYEAEQVSLGRRVALKVLPFAATADPRQLKRFHNEARAAASLEHPGVVPVYGVGCERGVHYYAMRFIDGRTLAELIDSLRGETRPSPTTPYSPGGPVPASETTAAAQTTESAPRDATYFRRVTEWCAQAAEALEHAHQLGVVHRDVKPHNLMTDEQGKLWVTDFGLARLAADGGLTMTGDLLGTLRYMSPEQALARHGLVDHRTDVYSLGATLYELLTLQPAVGGRDRQEVLRAIAFEEPTAPRKLAPAVPVDLETVVLKAMAKEPRERYLTAKELADDLRRLLDHRPIVARRPSWGQRLARWARRHQTVVRAAAAAAVAVGAALAGSTVLVSAAYQAEAGQRQEADRQAVGARDARAEEARVRAKAEDEREAAERRLYSAHMRLASRAWEDGNLSRLDELLELHRPAAGAPDRRGWEWGYLRSVHPSLGSTFPAHPEFACWSPAGQKLAWGGADGGEIQVRDFATGLAPFPLRGHTARVRSLAWDPAGRRLLSWSEDATVKVWDVAARKPVLTVPVVREEPIKFGWSPDGERFVVAGGTRGVRVWDIRSGKEASVLRGQKYGNFLRWSPDGRHLAVLGEKYTVWDTATGREVKLPCTPPTTSYGESLPDAAPLAWGPDGKRLYLIEGAGTVRAWDVAEVSPTLVLKESSAVALLRSPEGKRLATVSYESGVTVWDAVSGSRLFNVKSHSAVWSPDGRRLATPALLTGGNGLKVWDASSGAEVLTVRGVGSRLVGWSAGGERFATGTHAGPALQVWDMTRPQGYVAVRAGARPAPPAWSPDGQRLATGGEDGSIKVWEPAAGKLLTALAGQPEAVRSLAWSPDGRRLAAVGTQDPTVRVWDVSTGRLTRSLLSGRTRAMLMWAPPAIKPPFTGRPFTDSLARTPPRERRLWRSPGDVTWSLDGRLAAFHPDSTFRIWDPERGEELTSVELAETVGRLDWSPDGKHLAAAHHGGIFLWDTATWRLTPPPATAPPSTVEALAWRPDGEELATQHTDGEISLVEAGTWKPIQTMRGHSGASVAWSRDGRRLASAGWKSVTVWDPGIGEEVIELPSAHGRVVWAPDGRRVATWGGADGDVHIYDSPPSSLAPRSTEAAAPFSQEAATTAQTNLALALLKYGQYGDAEQAFRAALTLSERQGKKGQVSSSHYLRLGKLHQGLGIALKGGGRLAEAEQAYRKAMALLEAGAAIGRKVRWVDRKEACDQLALLLGELGRHREAEQEYRQLLKALPGHPALLNQLAWLLAHCPDAKVRDPKQAIRLAEEAFQKDRQPLYYMTLGMAYYRAGDLKSAVRALRPTTEREFRGTVGAAYAAFFLAMAHWRLDEKAEANRWLRDGELWMGNTVASDEDLHRFRDEARELLGLGALPRRPSPGP